LVGRFSFVYLSIWLELRVLLAVSREVHKSTHREFFSQENVMVEGRGITVSPVGVGGVPQQPLKPHRGVVVLVLGILGIVVCFICGIIAWAMGNNDLREMAAGTMDPSGRGMTQAGKICGMIGVILAIVGMCIYALLVIIAGAGAVMAITNNSFSR
jgi:hypothetical protein